MYHNNNRYCFFKWRDRLIKVSERLYPSAMRIYIKRLLFSKRIHVYDRKLAIHSINQSLRDIDPSLLINPVRYSLQTKAADKEYPLPAYINNTQGDDLQSNICSIQVEIATKTVSINRRTGSRREIDWLLTDHFKVDEMDSIMREYIEQKKSHCSIFILWAPALQYWDTLQAKMKADFNIVGWRDIYIDRDAVFQSLVYDIYGLETNYLKTHYITQKLKYLLHFPLMLRLIVCSLKNENRKVGAVAKKVKKHIRLLMDGIIPLEYFATCHASDCVEELEHLVRIFFYRTNLEMLNQRRIAQPRNVFLAWLNDYRKVLRQYNINPQDCCIVGSSPLEAMGLRNSAGIDFIVSKNVRQRYFDSGVVRINDFIKVVAEEEHRLTPKKFSDDMLIYNRDCHFYFRGLKLASLEMLRNHKQDSQEFKDIRDIYLIDKFFKR